MLYTYSMQRVSKGYTIVEVMIFLAVSAILFAATIGLINGKQAETQFNQKMRDTRSKIQDWLNDVSTGFTGGNPDTQNCIISGGRPQVNSGAPSVSPACIFLGKAIEFPVAGPNADQLQTYSVFGCRLKGCGPTGGLPASLSDATPTPQTAFTETYNLEPAIVKSVCSVAICSPTPIQSTQSHLIGFFTSFNTESTAQQNGNSDLDLDKFNFSGGPGAVNCLELMGGCASPTALTNYTICLSDGRRSAEIIISSQVGAGVETNLKYVAC
jgi:hypothetical protein